MGRYQLNDNANIDSRVEETTIGYYLSPKLVDPHFASKINSVLEALEKYGAEAGQTGEVFSKTLVFRQLHAFFSNIPDHVMVFWYSDKDPLALLKEDIPLMERAYGNAVREDSDRSDHVVMRWGQHLKMLASEYQDYILSNNITVLQPFMYDVIAVPRFAHNK